MQDNVGTITIATKVDKKGLKSGLLETGKILEEFDKKNDIEPEVELQVDTGKAEETIDDFKKRTKDVEVKIKYFTDKNGRSDILRTPLAPEEIGVPASTEETYDLDTHTVEGLKKIKPLVEEIKNRTEETSANARKTREEYWKQWEIARDIKLEQQEMAKYEKMRNELASMYEVPKLDFDIGIDEEKFDTTLEKMALKAGSIENELNRALNRRDELIENEVALERQLHLFGVEKGELLNNAYEYERINKLKLQGLQLTEEESNKLKELSPDASKYRAILDEYNKIINAQIKVNDNLETNDYRVRDLVLNHQELVNKAKEYADTTKEGSIEVGNIGKGFGKLLGKIGNIAMALVGVRTILNLITRSFNTLAQYNEELGTKMEQMRLVLAVALEPIINYIVSMLSVVLNIIDKIYTALFGISLYGRANELWSKKMAKNMASGAGSAKEMRKQLAGFDEMNVLNDNVAGSGGGGGGFDTQDFLLPDMEIPKGLQWIMDNAEPLGAIMGGVAGGALLMADGLIRLHLALQEYDKNPTLENFGEVVHRAGEAWAGFGMLSISPVQQIAGSIMAISGILTNHKKEVDKWVDDTVKNIDLKSKWLNENVSATLGSLLKNLGIDITFVKDDFFNLMGEAKNDFDSIGRVIQKFKEGDIKGAWNEITSWISSKWGIEKGRFNNAINEIKVKIVNLFNGIKTDILNVINFVINQFSGLKSQAQKIGTVIGELFGSAIKGVVNGLLSLAEQKINQFIRAINNVIGVIKNIPGVKISKLSTISLPRMAVGGIINQPGRGVPVGGAIAGESGREGILPLTDKQAMAELGREIGKWISIQATVPVNIGNRQIARVIQELNNDREFAMNS